MGSGIPGTGISSRRPIPCMGPPLIDFDQGEGSRIALDSILGRAGPSDFTLCQLLVPSLGSWNRRRRRGRASTASPPLKRGPVSAWAATSWARPTSSSRSSRSHFLFAFVVRLYLRGLQRTAVAVTRFDHLTA